MKKLWFGFLKVNVLSFGVLIWIGSRVLMQTLHWLRVPGDTVFAAGAVALVLFVAGLATGHSYQKSRS